MPKMDGVELLKVAKTIRPEVEVILITGYGTVDTAVTAMKDGAFDYIQKPFKPREILKLVRKAMEKQSLVLENRMLQERIKDFQKFGKDRRPQSGDEKGPGDRCPGRSRARQRF